MQAGTGMRCCREDYQGRDELQSVSMQAAKGKCVGKEKTDLLFVQYQSGTSQQA